MSTHDVDVVIIGSGFGGIISANRLALARLKVVVLERGPWCDSLPVRSMGIARRAPFPFVGLGGMRGIETLLLPPGAKKKLAKTVPLIGMDADTGKASVRFTKGRLHVDDDPEQQPK